MKEKDRIYTPLCVLAQRCLQNQRSRFTAEWREKGRRRDWRSTKNQDGKEIGAELTRTREKAGCGESDRRQA